MSVLSKLGTFMGLTPRDIEASEGAPTKNRNKRKRYMIQDLNGVSEENGKVKSLEAVKCVTITSKQKTGKLIDEREGGKEKETLGALSISGFKSSDPQHQAPENSNKTSNDEDSMPPLGQMPPTTIVNHLSNNNSPMKCPSGGRCVEARKDDANEQTEQETLSSPREIKNIRIARSHQYGFDGKMHEWMLPKSFQVIGPQNNDCKNGGGPCRGIDFKDFLISKSFDLVGETCRDSDYKSISGAHPRKSIRFSSARNMVDFKGVEKKESNYYARGPCNIDDEKYSLPVASSLSPPSVLLESETLNGSEAFSLGTQSDFNGEKSKIMPQELSQQNIQVSKNKEVPLNHAMFKASHTNEPINSKIDNNLHIRKQANERCNFMSSDGPNVPLLANDILNYRHQDTCSKQSAHVEQILPENINIRDNKGSKEFKNKGNAKAGSNKDKLNSNQNRIKNKDNYISGVVDLVEVNKCSIANATVNTVGNDNISPSLETLDYLPPMLALASAGLKEGNAFPDRLYPWQAHCLMHDPDILDGSKNLVIAAPTSSGKTMVAEILLLRALARDRKGLFVLPYVSLCDQEANRLEKLLKYSERDVRKAYGGESTVGSLGPRAGIVVATPEQASAIISRILRDYAEERGPPLHEVFSCIVIDEIHMVNEQGHRGCELELLVTKLRMAAEDQSNDCENISEALTTHTGYTYEMRASETGNSKKNIQIIAMSATMPNFNEFATWLNAIPYFTDFRPVRLQRWLKYGCNILDKNGNILRKLKPAGADDPDHVGLLVKEIVLCGQSVLIFCPTKNSSSFSKLRYSCQDEAKRLSAILSVDDSTLKLRRNRIQHSSFLQDGESDGNGNHIAELRQKLSLELSTFGGAHSLLLSKIVIHGVAYHHADLSRQIRDLIEKSFMSGIISVLCATSTLAAGVNLPARRVIFRSPKIGIEDLDVSRYIQMSGRAGRKGVDEEGDAILILPQDLERQEKDLFPKMSAMLKAQLPPVRSRLLDGDMVSKGTLEFICLKPSGVSPLEMNRFVMSTFAGQQDYEKTVDAVKQALEELGQLKMASFDRKKNIYLSTQLGRATFVASCRPREAIEIKSDIEKACQCWTLGNDLYPSFLLIPPHQDINMNMGPDHYRKLSILLDSCTEYDIKVLISIGGGSRSLIDQAIAFGQLGRLRDINDSTRRICRRLYMAFILRSLVNEMDPNDIFEEYNIKSTPIIEGLQENVARYAGRLKSFCEALGRLELKDNLDKFVKRTINGVKDELIPILPLCSLKLPINRTSLARTLFSAGLKSVEHVAAANIAEISDALQSGPKTLVKNVGVSALALRLKKYALELKRFEAKRAEHQLRKCEDGEIPSSLSFNSDEFKLSNETVNECSISNSKYDGDHSKEVKQKWKTNIRTPLSKKPKIENKIDNRKYVFDQTVLDVDSLECWKGNLDNRCFKEQTESREDKPCCLSCEEHSCASACPRVAKLSMSRFTFVKEASVINELVDVLKHKRRFGVQFHLNRESVLHPYGSGRIQGIAIAWEPNFQAYLPIVSCKSICGSVDDKFENSVYSQISELMASPDIEVVYKDFKPQVAATSTFMERGRYLNPSFKSESQTAALLPTNVIDARVAVWMANMSSSSFMAPTISFKEIPDFIENDQLHACKNAALALTMYSSCQEIISKMNLLDALKKSEIPLIPVLADMERHGIGINVRHLQYCRDAINERLTELPDLVLRSVGISKINCYEANRKPRSPSLKYKLNLDSRKHVEALLFEAMELKPPPIGLVTVRNEDGTSAEKISTRKDVLESLRSEHPAVDLVIEYRSLRKILGDVDGYLTFALNEGKRHIKHSDSPCKRKGVNVRSPFHGVQKIHAIFYQIESETGRITTGKDDRYGNKKSLCSFGIPSLQCMPKSVKISLQNLHGSENTTEVSIRSSIVPLHEGRILLSADFCHNELRLIAHFSNDAALIEMFHDEVDDPFRSLAATFFRVDVTSVSLQQRENAKQICYALVYGMGTPRLADTLKISISDAEVLKSNFLARFPGLQRWMDKELENCRRTGYITTVLGRKRWLPDINNDDKLARSAAERAAINSIVQGSAADMCKLAMINIHTGLINGVEDLSLPSKAGALILQIHDELLLEVDKCHLFRVCDLLRRCMEQAVPLQVPVKIKLKYGPSWGEMITM